MRVIASVVLVLVGCGSVNSPQKIADAAPPACVPETDTAFCSRVGKTCEMVADTDNCGAPRSADCGTCSATTPACVANVCKTPVCGNVFMGAPGTPVASTHVVGFQSAFMGASATGQSVMYLQATGQGGCVSGTSTLTIGDEAVAGTPPYVLHSLAAVANLNGFEKTEETMSLAADGLTIIGAATDGRSFLSSKRTTVSAIDFSVAVATDYATINAAIPAAPASVSWPVISADGLAFYYRVAGATAATTNGIYEALRTSTTMPFPAGTKMPANVQVFDAITGMSTDRMTAFVTMGFGTQLLTRTSLLQPFTAPTTSTPPGNAFRVVPIAGCTAIGTCEPGGCASEDICTWTNN